jgi:integrase
MSLSEQENTEPCVTKNVNPKVVSEMLGHSSIAVTLDTYSHVLPNMQDSAARALEEALR